MARGRPWNSHDDALLERFWRRGMTDTEIAQIMVSRTASAIKSRAHDIGLPARAEIRPHGKGGGIWTDERKEFVKKHYADGKSASEIVAMLDVPVTRNAVIGVIHRMGIKRAPGDSNRSLRTLHARHRQGSLNPPVMSQPRPSQMPQIARAEAIEIAAAEKMLPLRDLEHNQCCWPIGDPQTKPFGFCGGPKVPGLPYCKPHALRAYTDGETAIQRAEKREREKPTVQRVKEDAL